MKLFNTIKEKMAGSNILSNNLGWKLFSLVTAVMLWLMVINIANPKETWSFTVPLSLDKVEVLEEVDLAVKNLANYENRTITVRVRGRRQSLEKLQRWESEMRVVANFDTIMVKLDEPVKVALEVEFPRSRLNAREDVFDYIGIEPSAVEVYLEEIITIEKPVKVNVKGEAMDGFVALAPEASPATVQVRGPKSALEKVTFVSVNVDVENANQDITVTEIVQFLDANENEVSGVGSETNEVVVSVKVNKYKKVPVYATYQFAPADGYLVTGITWEPRELEIVGADVNVNDFTQIDLPAIELTNTETENQTHTLDIRRLNLLPADVSIRNGTPNEITITINIEKVETQDLTIDSQSLELSGDMKPDMLYTVLSENAAFTIKGTSVALAALNLDEIVATLDVSALNEGEHEVLLTLPLPTGVLFVGDPPTVTVRVEPQIEPEGDDNAQEPLLPDNDVDEGEV